MYIMPETAIVVDGPVNPDPLLACPQIACIIGGKEFVACRTYLLIMSVLVCLTHVHFNACLQSQFCLYNYYVFVYRWFGPGSSIFNVMSGNIFITKWALMI